MWRGWTADRLVVGRCKTWESAAIMCGQRVACKRPGFCAIDRGEGEALQLPPPTLRRSDAMRGRKRTREQSVTPVNQLVLNAEAKWARRPRV